YPEARRHSRSDDDRSGETREHFLVADARLAPSEITDILEREEHQRIDRRRPENSARRRYRAGRFHAFIEAAFGGRRHSHSKKADERGRGGYTLWPPCRSGARICRYRPERGDQ